ncbi:MAG TPA: energy-coupled thiamine transporter ThiT [Synergistaceae bacterium]|uniref:energy-coupled thiamine transporter ThiT n=1 Tax=Synergistaceae TaxID=649777 RepID=UPI000ED7B1E0|nr:energy-coupled thiamine transporter ThiT [Synergistaceae bacterium DZ-S4]HAH70060.1 energy-coupled thiamine transporter ThiT [Synergistaceae bacterium]
MKVPIKILAEGSLCIALSAALSFVRLFALPQGGSVSLGMLPILIFALRRGGSAGVSAGLAVGMLKLFMGGYVIHPIQALLDYPVANALIGTAGFFRANRYLGAAAASLMNLFASVLSGVVFFSDYAPEGMNVWLYSFLYNASVVIPEAVICIALIYLILPRLDKIGR